MGGGDDVREGVKSTGGEADKSVVIQLWRSASGAVQHGGRE